MFLQIERDNTKLFIKTQVSGEGIMLTTTTITTKMGKIARKTNPCKILEKAKLLLQTTRT